MSHKQSHKQSHKFRFSTLLLLSLAGTIFSTSLATTIRSASAQIPGGPPNTPPTNIPTNQPPRPPLGTPVPDPIIDLPESDPFLEDLDSPEIFTDEADDNILEIDESIRPDLESTENEENLSAGNELPGIPLAASGALTEVAILAGFLPEPMFTIALPTGENDTAAGNNSAGSSLSAAINPNEGEVDPGGAVDLGEPIEPGEPGEPDGTPGENPAEAELGEITPGEIEPGEIEPGEATLVEVEPAETSTEETTSASASNNPSTATALNCQAQARDLSTAEIASDRTSAVYQALSLCYQQNLDNAISTQNKPQELISLNNLAAAQFVVGNYLRAQELHSQQLATAQQQNNALHIGIAQAGIGANLAAVGDYPQAIARYQTSLTQLSSIPATSTTHTDAIQWQSLTLRNLGNAHYAQQDFEQATNYQQQSLDLSQSINDRYGEMQALGNLANLSAIANQTEATIATYRQALSLAQSLQQANEEAQILLGLGTAYYYLQNYQTAADYYRQSLALTQQLGAKLGEGLALTNLGETLLRQNRLSEAETALSQSIDIWERLQAGLGNNNKFKISLFETQRAAYRNLQEVLIKSDRTATALEISERGRTRAFVELLARGTVIQPAQSANAQANASAAPPTLSELQQTAIAKQITLVEYAIVRDQFASIPHGAAPQQSAPNANLNPTQQPQAAQLYIWVIQPTGQITFRQVDLQELSLPIAQLVETSRSQLKSSGALRIAATQQVNANAIANTSPIDITTLSPGDLVRRQGEPTHWLPYQVTAINLDANTVSVTHPNFTLPNPNLPAGELLPFTDPIPPNSPPVPLNPNQTPLKQLHELLIDPISDLLPTDPTAPVVFIPQEQLFLIPFAALQNSEGQYLIDQHTILTAPSIQALSLITPSATPRQQNPLIVGNPSPMPQSLAPLPHAQTEAEIIGHTLTTEALTLNAATESTIKQQLPSAGLIHLATHGFFNESDPFQGALALAPDSASDHNSADNGFLTVAEILSQPLSAQLVVLSACDTGRGRITGDGVIGFSRSFLAAGAARVIVSLWQVPDEATASLMVDFYQQLQQGQSEAQALRQAMLNTREIYPNPHDWAAFTFIGDHRPSQ